MRTSSPLSKAARLAARRERMGGSRPLQPLTEHAMRFFLPFAVWFLIGFVGIVAMATQIGLDQLRAVEDAPAIGDMGLRVVLVIQPAILLAIAVAVGVALQNRAGLSSWLTNRLRGDRLPLLSFTSLSGTLALTVAVALLALFLDVLFRVAAPADFAGLPAAPLATLPRVSALLYGGFTEELMLRYGLMTALAAIGTMLLGAKEGPRRRVMMWIVVVLVALAFGAGHLPALAMMIEPTGIVVLRTLLLNGMLGVLYGWLYWRYGIEHAIVSHAFTHGVFWLAGPLTAEFAWLM